MFSIVAISGRIFSIGLYPSTDDRKQTSNPVNLQAEMMDLSSNPDMFDFNEVYDTISYEDLCKRRAALLTKENSCLSVVMPKGDMK